VFRRRPCSLWAPPVPHAHRAACHVPAV